MSPSRPSLPLTPLSYQVLLALADRPLHGYGIIKEIEEREGETAAPSTGALYLALQRMGREGLIDEAEAPENETDARRRYYRLTRTGRSLAEAESVRLAAQVATARARDLLPGGGA